jgi:hypothetical protein
MPTMHPCQCKLTRGCLVVETVHRPPIRDEDLRLFQHKSVASLRDLGERLPVIKKPPYERAQQYVFVSQLLSMTYSG